VVGSHQKVFVIGHRNPDADCVCGAIAYAYFKNAVDKTRLFIPARAGALNKETSFILDYFGLETPLLIKSVVARVSDIDLKPPICILPHEPIQKAAQVMREKNIRTLPVVDEYQHLIGMVGQRDIARYYVEKIDWDKIEPIELKTLIQTLDGRVLANAKKLDHIKGRIIVAAMQKSTLLHYIKPGDIAVLGDRVDIQADLIKSGCQVLILGEDTIVGEEIIGLANQHGTLIITSPKSIYTIVQLLHLALPVTTIMSKPKFSVSLDTPISEVKKRVLISKYRSVTVIDSENRLIGIVTRSDLIPGIRKKVILIDHNEVSQAVLGIQEADILEIIDHHRQGDISTLSPIFVYNDPIGSSCTIIAELMKLRNVEIPPQIAGALLGGILSDTLVLTLSTTTDRDKKMAHMMAKRAGVKLEEFGRKLIGIQADIRGKTVREIIGADFKEYQIGDKKIGIGQLLTLDRAEVSVLEKEIKEELERLLKEKKYDLVAFTITNPFDKKGEEIFVKGERGIIEKAFNVVVKDDYCAIPYILSRKKDLVPRLGEVLLEYET